MSNFPFFAGPVTVPMVSQSGSPPIPMPVQVPPGHVMQQIVDENGTLRHVILSTQHQQLQGGVQGVQHHIHGHYVSSVTFTSYPWLQREKLSNRNKSLLVCCSVLGLLGICIKRGGHFVTLFSVLLPMQKRPDDTLSEHSRTALCIR